MNMSIKKLFATKKVVVVGTAVALTLGLSGAAYAFFAASGTGSGTATVGSPTSWTVAQLTGPFGVSGGPLYPDAASGYAAGTVTPGMNPAQSNVERITYSVTNGGTTSQYLTSVKISVNPSWSVQSDTSLPACTAADFSIMLGYPTAVDQLQGGTATDTGFGAGYVAAGASKLGSFGIEMIDNSANQNNCQGVTVPLIFVAN
jgi:hypothetical protein